MATEVPGPDIASEAASRVTAAATKALAAAKGPVHALRGTGEAEKLLKNAKTELWNEHEEIANYLAIETLAQAVGDKETEKLAREHRRQEERMAAFLQKLIPQLAKAVATEEIPAAERRKPAARRTTRTRSSRPARARPAASPPPGARRRAAARAPAAPRSQPDRVSAAGADEDRLVGERRVVEQRADPLALAERADPADDVAVARSASHGRFTRRKPRALAGKQPS